MVEVASEERVAGWVRNVPDGTVEALIEGEEERVRRVVEWTRRGPPRARVDSVRTDMLQVRNLHGFRIEG